MCFCWKICLSVEQLKQNVCFHIHPLKFGMHYHFALDKYIIYIQTFKCKLKCDYFELAFCDVLDF